MYGWLDAAGCGILHPRSQCMHAVDSLVVSTCYIYMYVDIVVVEAPFVSVIGRNRIV